MTDDEPYASVWDSVANTVAEAEVFKARSRLLVEITRRLEAVGWTQKQAAEHLGLTRPRVRELFNQRIDRFTVEDLITIGVGLGMKSESE